MLVFVLFMAVVAFFAFQALLLVASPKRYAAFLRWCSFGKNHLSELTPKLDAQYRVVGFVILVMILGFAWVLVEKYLAGDFYSPDEHIATARMQGNWSNFLPGVLSILAGAYALLKTKSVQLWFGKQGIHPDRLTTNNIKGLGVLFLWVGLLVLAITLTRYK